MWNFLVTFDDEYSELCGECIFVQCDSWEEADNFMFSDDNPFKGEHFCYGGRFSDAEAEAMGYDTY